MIYIFIYNYCQIDSNLPGVPLVLPCLEPAGSRLSLSLTITREIILLLYVHCPTKLDRPDKILILLTGPPRSESGVDDVVRNYGLIVLFTMILPAIYFYTRPLHAMSRQEKEVSPLPFPLSQHPLIPSNPLTPGTCCCLLQLPDHDSSRLHLRIRLHLWCRLLLHAAPL